MNSIALETEKHLDLTELSRSLREFKNVDLSSPIAYKKVIDYSSCVTANLLKAAAIICITEDGATPNILSSYRAKSPIFSITKNELVARQLALVWNVQPVFVESSTDNRDLIQKGIEKLKEVKLLIPGDTVVISGNDKDEGKHASMVSVVMQVK